jgi:hypothetical protein
MCRGSEEDARHMVTQCVGAVMEGGRVLSWLEEPAAAVPGAQRLAGLAGVQRDEWRGLLYLLVGRVPEELAAEWRALWRFAAGDRDEWLVKGGQVLQAIWTGRCSALQQARRDGLLGDDEEAEYQLFSGRAEVCEWEWADIGGRQQRLEGLSVLSRLARAKWGDVHHKRGR